MAYDSQMRTIIRTLEEAEEAMGDSYHNIDFDSAIAEAQEVYDSDIDNIRKEFDALSFKIDELENLASTIRSYAADVDKAIYNVEA